MSSPHSKQKLIIYYQKNYHQQRQKIETSNIKIFPFTKSYLKPYLKTKKQQDNRDKYHNNMQSKSCKKFKIPIRYNSGCDSYERKNRTLKLNTKHLSMIQKQIKTDISQKYIQNQLNIICDNPENEIKISNKQAKYLNFLINKNKQPIDIQKKKKTKKPLIIFQNLYNVPKQQSNITNQTKNMKSIINIQKIQKKQKSVSPQKIKQFILSKNKQLLGSNLLSTQPTRNFIHSRQRKQISRRLLASIAKTKYLCQQTNNNNYKKYKQINLSGQQLRSVPSQLGVTKKQVSSKSSKSNLISKPKISQQKDKKIYNHISRSKTDKLLIRSFTHNIQEITPWENNYYDQL